MPDTKQEKVRRSKPFIESTPEGIEDGSNAPDDVQVSPATIPLPGARDRKKEPLEIQKKSRPRKLLNQKELQTQEANLRKRYPHLVQGTLLNATKGNPLEGLTAEEVQRFHHKRSCIIKCTCGTTRRIATSDLAQVKLCPDCTKDERNRRKRERRAAAKK